MESNKIKHIAFIMDGNRRWAVENGLEKMEGHTKGVENFKNIVEICGNKGIPQITFWALSTENLKNRGDAELKHLFKLLGQIRDYLKMFVEKEVSIKYIGDLTKLPTALRTILKDLEYKTKDHKKMVVTLAINYGGKDEILRMVKNVVSQVEKMNQISEKVINSVIDTGFLTPVDMIIRTGGHKRLSGFLPWIADYSELYFTDKKWPEFDEVELDKALNWFYEQQRNFGK